MSPVGYANGSPWNQQATLYYIPSTDADAYYIGDLVKSFDLIETTYGTYAPYIAKASAGNTCRGVIVGFQFPDQVANGSGFDPSILYVPATKSRGYWAWVVDDPNVIFEMTDDGDSVASDWIGKNTNFTVAAPSAPTVNPLSATVIDGSTVATTNTLPLKIIGMKRTAGNSIAAYARWLVKFNTHEFFGSTTGV